MSIRTIQRVEKDGVASNETVAAYAAIFAVKVDELFIDLDDFGNTKRQDSNLGFGAFIGSLVFALGLASGIGLTLWLF